MEKEKKQVEKELEARINEIEERFHTKIEEELSNVKEQLKIVSSSAERIEDIEKDFQRHVHEDLELIRAELSAITSSISKLEGEISENWNVLVKLRSHSYDKLMSEYKEVEKKILIERATTEEFNEEEPTSK